MLMLILTVRAERTLWISHSLASMRVLGIRRIYLLENRNAKSRIRDKKRLAYMGFLKWCEAHPDLPAFSYPNDKSAWLPRIAEHFPHFQAEYDQAVADLAELRAVKAKFNGEWVSKLTGLQGKELGGLMMICMAWTKFDMSLFSHDI